MPKRASNNVIDLHTGKPIVETPKKKSAKVPTTPDAEQHIWEFKSRFRRKAFGWKSQPAITRIKQAVSEIKKVARKNPALGGEGAVLLIERLSPALENVDSSSGSIGGAVNKAIEDLVPIIATASVDQTTREDWLKRLWKAHMEDDIPYIEILGDVWGELCSTTDLASKWANGLIEEVRSSWADHKPGSFFQGTSGCLSALLKAERYEELLDLLVLERHKIWHYQVFGAKALANMGKVTEAIKFAKACEDLRDTDCGIARTCEELLLSVNQVEEAYQQYAIKANRENSYLSTFRTIAKKYPSIPSDRIIKDLIKSTPGEEYKWFATAKELGMLDLALELARKGPCDPRTLTRAARDHVETNPDFAMRVGLISLAWLLEGYGYDITSVDVWAAYDSTMAAAEKIGREMDARDRISEAVKTGLAKKSAVAKVLSGVVDRH